MNTENPMLGISNLHTINASCLFETFLYVHKFLTSVLKRILTNIKRFLVSGFGKWIKHFYSHSALSSADNGTSLTEFNVQIIQDRAQGIS